MQTSDELVVDLESQGDFKAPGLRATFDAEGASRTRAMVDGQDEGEPAGGGVNPAPVHRGTCEEPIAAETYVIGQLKGPVAEADINVPISDLVGGGYVLEVNLLPQKDVQGQTRSSAARSSPMRSRRGANFRNAGAVRESTACFAEAIAG